jgi:hypothetical protein
MNVYLFAFLSDYVYRLVVSTLAVPCREKGTGHTGSYTPKILADKE